MREAAASAGTWVRISGTAWVQPPFSPPGSSPSARNCAISQATVRVSPSVPGARPCSSSEASARVQSDRRCGSTGAQEAGEAGSAGRGADRRAGRKAPARRGSKAAFSSAPSLAHFAAETRLLDRRSFPSSNKVRRHASGSFRSPASSPRRLRASRPRARVQAAALAYPETARGDVVEEQFGERVADPYRWLENDVRQDPARARLGDRAEPS